jgi:hypothetical protein
MGERVADASVQIVLAHWHGPESASCPPFTRSFEFIRSLSQASLEIMQTAPALRPYHQALVRMAGAPDTTRFAIRDLVPKQLAVVTDIPHTPAVILLSLIDAEGKKGRMLRTDAPGAKAKDVYVKRFEVTTAVAFLTDWHNFIIKPVQSYPPMPGAHHLLPLFERSKR